VLVGVVVVVVVSCEGSVEVVGVVVVPVVVLSSELGSITAVVGNAARISFSSVRVRGESGLNELTFRAINPCEMTVRICGFAQLAELFFAPAAGAIRITAPAQASRIGRLKR
jgi:hypothetical protein